METDQHCKDSVLVCVNYGQTGRRLIRRAGELSKKLGAELIILIFDTLPNEEYAYHKEADIAAFKELAKVYQARVIIKWTKAKDITKEIVKTAKSENVSLIVIGQMAESIWTTVFGHSMVDVLLKEVPTADLQVIPSQRSSAKEEWVYDLGYRAHIVEDKDDGMYHMYYGKSPDCNCKYEGIFLKSLYTECENGKITFLAEDKRPMEAKVVDGIVHSFIDIKEEQL
ncbi:MULTISPECIES: universal stress protein [Bacillaceae]|uniref:Universal stress protein n=1 Tax=Evansella alkalicola TaxID=745819 RepID=A0ABS6JYN8_9BACI|nr:MULTISPECIES: universal stress protein [Bacillaceae]MBU9723707.1 universal stress protein [Bacillus alkalicola]